LLQQKFRLLCLRLRYFTCTADVLQQRHKWLLDDDILVGCLDAGDGVEGNVEWLRLRTKVDTLVEKNEDEMIYFLGTTGTSKMQQRTIEQIA
jgi:hypothetical protein